VRDHFEGGVLAYESNPAGARNRVLTAKSLRLSRLR
jgi:hypothetical protein